MNKTRLLRRSRFVYTEKAKGGGAEVNNFIYENATKTYFGKGCVKEYLACLLKHFGENVMFAYGKGSIKENGIYDEIMASLNKAGKNIIEFSDIMPNPTYAKVLEGAKLARENQINFILAAGGGSVMDCCKAVSMAAVYKGDLWNDFFARPGVMEFEPIPLGVVVTAGGTGSEMSGKAVITNEKLKVKTGRDYPKCNPGFALIDPTYTYTVSERQMVSGGFDTLSHMMEIYFGKPDEDNVSDDMAEGLMRSVIRNLRVALLNPRDYTARSNLLWDAAMAGNRILKLGKQTDFQCRQMGCQLAAYINCNHGEGLAVLHPVYYRHLYGNECVKFKKFAVNVWGISETGKTAEETAREGVEALRDFIRELGLPATLRELGADENTELKRIADSCIFPAGSDKPMTREEILKMFQECY